MLANVCRHTQVQKNSTLPGSRQNRPEKFLVSINNTTVNFCSNKYLSDISFPLKIM